MLVTISMSRSAIGPSQELKNWSGCPLPGRQPPAFPALFISGTLETAISLTAPGVMYHPGPSADPANRGQGDSRAELLGRGNVKALDCLRAPHTSVCPAITNQADRSRCGPHL